MIRQRRPTTLSLELRFVRYKVIGLDLEPSDYISKCAGYPQYLLYLGYFSNNKF